MNPPSTGRKIVAVVAGVFVMAAVAALVFLLLEAIFSGSRPRTGDKDEKYRLFSERVVWSFYLSLFIAAFTGAVTTLAIVKAAMLKLACITVCTPLVIVTLSLLFDPEGKKPDAQVLPMAACLLAGAWLAWYLFKSSKNKTQITNGAP